MNDLNLNNLLMDDGSNKAADLPAADAALPEVATPETTAQLDKKMADIELKNLEKITEAKADQTGTAYINLKGFPISPEAIGLIPEEQALALKVVCFFYTGSELRLGSLNPQNPQVKAIAQELSAKYHSHIETYLISQESFDLAFKIYEKIPKIRKFVKGVEITEENLLKFQANISFFADLQKQIDQVNVTELVTLLIAAALKTESSDIHIEAEEKDIKVRFRIDGVLHTVAKIPPEDWEKIISRLKLISGLKLNITDKPQDGRFTIFLTGDKVEVRVSAIPTSYGESVVMRLLRSSATGLKFEDLGIRGKAFVDLMHEVARPNGMIISTGPTGSGKTTTLYAIINKLNKPETKIITLEDPIEYKLEGVNQSQIEHEKDYTFAKGLRALLRQDPDIVMVGEIRDLETAEVTINASLTGHLVISTIHTNNAAGAIPRFLAMGVKPYLLSPSLNAVIGQRLVRKICPQCKIEDQVNNDTMTKILNILSKIPMKSAVRLEDSELHNLKFYKGQGCLACQGLGYKGRIGIFEILTMSPEIEKIILSDKVSDSEIQEMAVNGGMVTMVQDGLLKAKDGITTIEEVFKVAD
ncbi:MAG: GspE/PulE family protein [Candidatus Komeilibacteria bacterium]|nr:GspE/PulE family protein [Candidatus Komeilibacteria bacterium]